MMCLCIVVSDVSNYDRCRSVHFYVLMQVSFCLVSVFRANRCMVLAEMTGCQVGKGNVGK